MSEKRTPKLTLIMDGAVQMDFELTKEITKIGRSTAECDIIINDKMSSRVHAEITNLDGECYIRDCDSRNGTLHNDLPVQEARLFHDDEIKIGKTMFRYIDPDGVSENEEAFELEDRSEEHTSELQSH